MSEKVYIFLADGFEEIEGLTVVDILRRASVDIEMVSITGSRSVRGSHGICVEADRLFEGNELADGAMYVLPGGMPGTRYLGEHEGLCALLKNAKAQGRIVAAICAAPQVLAKAGISRGRRLTSYPGQKFYDLFADADYVDDNRKTEECVVVDGNLITSRGPATTLPFAYRLVEILGGDADALRKAMQYEALKEALRH